MTNYAVEDYRSWWAESVGTSIAAKKMEMGTLTEYGVLTTINIRNKMWKFRKEVKI